MTGRLVRQWHAADDRPMRIRLRDGMRFIGTYWYACPYRWHRHVFHGEHVAADMVAAEELCETPATESGQLQLPRPRRGERRVDGHALAPVPTAADDHYGRPDA